MFCSFLPEGCGCIFWVQHDNQPALHPIDECSWVLQNKFAATKKDHSNILQRIPQLDFSRITGPVVSDLQHWTVWKSLEPPIQKHAFAILPWSIMKPPSQTSQTPCQSRPALDLRRFYRARFPHRQRLCQQDQIVKPALLRKTKGSNKTSINIH